jgi:hypothetical protein
MVELCDVSDAKNIRETAVNVTTGVAMEVARIRAVDRVFRRIGISEVQIH